MTRRERLLHIIANMGDHRATTAVRQLLARDDRFTKFTDEAIEELAALLVRDWRFEQLLNAENRYRFAAKAKEEAA